MKNIILLSDGTGNGSAKKNKTNVWRLYDALDLHNDQQIAMYDDGVGSKESTFYKAMGGAFGYGLQRNVIELYKYLCRNYRTAEQNGDKDDKIYLFGFSRGAFTVRVLAGFITFAGLYTDFEDEEDLHKQARINYGCYRYRYKHGYLTRFFKKVFDEQDKLKSTVKPVIEFIGVWDTVDAYVFPMDEFAQLWDLLIYPIRFPDSKLNKKILHACHAVSIDDERHTFHPVMWDESGGSGGRIKQVWFPGVHTDVGGGYSRRSLSLITLDWMITQVEDKDVNKGLVYIKDLRDQYKSKSDWNAPQHDSRSGLASYYRYKPRNIDHICNDEDAGVSIATPKIHRSALERIKGRALPYAPTGIPAEYEVDATEGNAPKFETDEEAVKRTSALNYALDIILWRRVLYFALLLATVLLVSSRFFLDWEEDGVCKGTACAIDPLLQVAIDTLPGFAAGWLEALRQNAAWMWSFIAIFLVLFLLKDISWRATRKHAMCAWAKLRGKGSVPVWKETLTSKLRLILHSGIGVMMGWLSAFVLLLVILYLLFASVNSSVFHLRNTFGILCEPSVNTSVLAGTKIVPLDISNACFATGIKLEFGKTYRFTVKADQYVKDGVYSADADGVKDPGILMSSAIPLRRHVTQPWIKLFGRIGHDGNDNYVLGVGENKYTARSDGELFLYVNDAVFGVLADWDLPYSWKGGENKGVIEVMVDIDGD
ncbi:MAG: DUF2235 domain-containing protein [Gammaproteobacteria bacterium]|nr:DUF2235 domain-containing protein [Gammaproteobacteria bacterium]